MQLRKLHDHVGLPITEQDENDWILPLGLLITAAHATITVTTT
jgi:hypothetical protein